MLALDTNVLARYYVREEDASRATQAQHEAARRIIDGGEELFVAKTVLLELEWVLRGVYGIGRKDIVRSLEHLLALPNVEVEDRPAVQGALANLRAGFDFADALHHASSRACAALVTFDARRFANRARRMSLSPPVRIAR
jgi:predicted nucleic-acid-binding protein